jgi:riboflavin biosynthesis pyrimidine reductase
MPGDTPLEPLEMLYESDDLPQEPLPKTLERLHGGPFGLAAECVYANFVASLDGVVAIPGMKGSNDFVAGGSDADRFLMGLLRAYADAVLIGAGVLRASPRGTWRPEKIYPPAADAYEALREQLGLPPAPEIAVLTGHGSVDPDHPLFATGALVLTSDAGAERLGSVLPPATTVVTLGDSTTIAPRAVVDALRARGHRRILCEAGPHTFGGLLADGAVDELFLTTSPLLAGDAGPGSRLRLVEAADLAPDEIRPRLLSLRLHGSHVFHRYELR